MSHTTVYVIDQDKAYHFYVELLGFKVKTDSRMENGFRWLTVSPPEQPDLEIVLFPATFEGNGYELEVREALTKLLEKEVLGAGVFYTPDVRASYEELRTKGVIFRSEPKEQFYGTECIIADGCGNWFSLTQPK